MTEAAPIVVDARRFELVKSLGFPRSVTDAALETLKQKGEIVIIDEQENKNANRN
jgi:hypothetical protein